MAYEAEEGCATSIGDARRAASDSISIPGPRTLWMGPRRKALPDRHHPVDMEHEKLGLLKRHETSCAIAWFSI